MGWGRGGEQSLRRGEGAEPAGILMARGASRERDDVCLGIHVSQTLQEGSERFQGILVRSHLRAEERTAPVDGRAGFLSYLCYQPDL